MSARPDPPPPGGPLEPDVLDAGLQLAMEWGDDWLRPIQDRLSRALPHLDRQALDAYDQACREAMRAGHDAVPAHWNAAEGDKGRAFATFTAALRGPYPWISDASLTRLFSQGCYYGWRDGALAGL